jgi:alkylhydroperoxidase/carboxymuconolactone decarboxylase family protein YurZ
MRIEQIDAVRERFIARRGYWNDSWEFILGEDPEYVDAYTDLSSYAWEEGGLDAKIREFVYIATVASVTHLFPLGIRQHMLNAFAAGATRAELLTVLELVSTIGLQTYQLAITTLRDVAGDDARAVRGELPDERRRAIAARHAELFGEVDAAARVAIEGDGAFYERILAISAVPLAKTDVLPLRTMHLVLLAAYASVTHLCGPGVRTHMRAALAHGATPAEVMEVCELITGMSVHTLSIGLPILAELVDERGERVT